MTLKQLGRLHRWHVAHGRDHPCECEVCHLVLMLWVLGWAALPAIALMHAPWLVPLSLAGWLAPDAYRALRRRLAASGRLRCDWLGLLEQR
jgi:hypothetical protein